MGNLEKVDLEVYQAIRDEISRQSDKLEMIASENFVSLAVLWLLLWYMRRNKTFVKI